MSVLLCVKHNLPLLDKKYKGSVFTGLILFRIQYGDKVLKDHLESGAKKSLYISHEIKNESIKTCTDVF